MSRYLAGYEGSGDTNKIPFLVHIFVQKATYSNFQLLGQTVDVVRWYISQAVYLLFSETRSPAQVQQKTSCLKINFEVQAFFSQNWVFKPIQVASQASALRTTDKI